MRRLWVALLLAAPAAAQTALPDVAAVEAALEGHPAVTAARADVAAARARARAMAVGSHEFTASASLGRREVREIGDFTEYDASLSRAIRLPGKAALDRKAGDAGILAAENMADDARHQAALILSDLWWEWLGAAAERRVLERSAATLGKAAEAVTRRQALREAAALEKEQADAAHALARAAARAAAGREAAARAALAAQFPMLPLPATVPAMPAPELPPEGLAALGALVTERSHEIGAVVARADQADLMAKRIRRDRIADPSIGVRGFSEFDGAERGVGLLVSVPLGGRHRRALADEAEAAAGAAQARAATVRQEILALSGRDVASAEAAFAAWKDSEAAATASTSATARAARGHALGGLDLADRLYAERLAQEMALAEAQARAEAWRAITRLRIDSHTLWMHAD